MLSSKFSEYNIITSKLEFSSNYSIEIGSSSFHKKSSIDFGSYKITLFVLFVELR